MHHISVGAPHQSSLQLLRSCLAPAPKSTPEKIDEIHHSLCSRYVVCVPLLASTALHRACGGSSKFPFFVVKHNTHNHRHVNSSPKQKLAANSSYHKYHINDSITIASSR